MTQTRIRTITAPVDIGHARPRRALPALRLPLAWGVRVLRVLTVTLLTFAGLASADPPQRVARLNVISGDIGYLPAGDDRWRDADLNRPLVVGDRLHTESEARTELDMGGAVLRLDERSDVRLLNLDDEIAQLELTEGSVDLAVRSLHDGQRYEVNTPMMALVIEEPGEYRVDVDARDGATRLSVIDGSATVHGQRGVSERVRAGRSYRFDDTGWQDVEADDLPRADDFDDWCLSRDERYRNAETRRYVPDDMIGYSDLDDYGDWREESDYGPVWYPRRVVTGWAPYRDGHWAWVEPWGWTWVDNAPWGFAPSHYGRWVYVSHRWGWLPGPRTLRPVYAPALVAFIGGGDWSLGISYGTSPIGWYPLGARDVYVPSYRCSRDYFRNVNVSNIHNHTVINNTHITNIYNNYTGGRPVGDLRHAYRDQPSAVTAVSRDTFVHARPVAKSRARLKDGDIARAGIITQPTLTPTEDSLAPRVRDSRRPQPDKRHVRDVITHTKPLPSARPFHERLDKIERDNRRREPVDGKARPSPQSGHRRATEKGPAITQQPLSQERNAAVADSGRVEGRARNTGRETVRAERPGAMTRQRNAGRVVASGQDAPVARATGQVPQRSSRVARQGPGPVQEAASADRERRVPVPVPVQAPAVVERSLPRVQEQPLSARRQAQAKAQARSASPRLEGRQRPAPPVMETRQVVRPERPARPVERSVRKEATPVSAPPARAEPVRQQNGARGSERRERPSRSAADVHAQAEVPTPVEVRGLRR